jgi:hypothetical protein
MLVHANLLKDGDKIIGLGPVTAVHIYGQQQAVLGPTNMPWPDGRGALMHAALARMAVADCYRWVATTVQVNIGKVVRYFDPNEMVEVVGEGVALAKAA